MALVTSSILLLAFGGGPVAPPAPYAPTLDGPPIVDPHTHAPDPSAALRSPTEPTRAGPPLQVPWTCGQTEYCTQGHNGGSHTGTSSWAWDFALQDGEEIWAASAGVVTHLRMNMTDGGCDSAFSGSANYITIDNGDGTSTVYLHMRANSSPLAVGELVEVGDLVARVGATGYACGAHLHMQVQNTCGSYYCQSVSATFADYGDPSASVQYQGTNCPECPLSLDGGTTIIDDENAGCLVRQTSAWWSSFQGHEDHHFWTRAIAAGTADSSARWRFGVTVPGDYAVEVFIPNADADTTNATYQIHHADGTAEVVIDQSTQKGWQALGTFAFTGSGGEGIELGDNTGEDVGLDRRIAYDAVRMTFEPVAGTSGGDETGGGSGDTDPGVTSGPAGSGDTGGGGGSGAGDGVTGSSAGTSGAEGGETDPALPHGFGEGEDSGGCGCRSDRPRPLGSVLALGLLILGLRRRP